MRPRLIQPVNIVIRRLDGVATNWDDVFKEPANGAPVTYKAAETIRAQVVFARFEDRNMTPGGDSPMTSGYLLYDREKVPQLKRGDKVESIGGSPVTVYITNDAEPTTPYGGKFYFDRANFQERVKG